MTFIRKVKTASGATAVQIVRKSKGRIVKVDHIGSAHTNEDLNALLSLAEKRLLGDQQSLFPDSNISSLTVGLKQSYSRLLFQVLKEQYQQLEFCKLDDEYFMYLCLARIVEPTSKLDSLRVLADLGGAHLDKNRLYRCLSEVIRKKTTRQPFLLSVLIRLPYRD